MIATVSTKWFRFGFESGPDKPNDNEEGESMVSNLDGDFDPAPGIDDQTEVRFGFHG